MADLHLDPEIVALGREAARAAWIRCEGRVVEAMAELESRYAPETGRVYLHAARNELQVLLARSEAHRAGKDGPK